MQLTSVSIAITSAGGTIQAPTAGSAILSGVFSGSGGTLVVAGPSPTGTGDVFVTPAGMLMGTGTIAGNGLVSGVLKPGNSPGYLSFTQNLTLNSGICPQAENPIKHPFTPIYQGQKQVSHF